ncbi:hypothetical protein RN001_010054 [Aquatica leii]|uniref:Uncharacterized protein n=1 Tax=Aquatica leii TaxID=1421715 RepID=A0AAN7QH76_9COLE|nr:hypothetical protein RN001_010054 [Aquatica leii]
MLPSSHIIQDDEQIEINPLLVSSDAGSVPGFNGIRNSFKTDEERENEEVEKEEVELPDTEENGAADMNENELDDPEPKNQFNRRIGKNNKNRTKDCKKSSTILLAMSSSCTGIWCI